MTPVNVCNIALQEIGSQGAVSSINPSDGSREGDVASLFYQPKIDSLHRAAHWNCTRFQEFLTLLKAAPGTPENPDGTNPTPPQPWQYEYLYPTDCLKARYIIPWVQSTSVDPPFTTAPSNNIPWIWANPGARFAVATDTDADGNLGRVILTNACTAQLVYTKRIINVDLWDPAFLDAACAVLGAWFSQALARNRGVFQDQINLAKEIIAQARVSDGDEGITTQTHFPDWVRIRGTPGLSLYSDGWNVAGWDTMSLPGGVLI